MSKFINSNEAASSSLMLWQTKPTQVSIKDTYDIKVWPITNIFNDAPISFSIPEQPHGMMKDINIVTKFKIQKDGKDITEIQDNLSVINNISNSLWQVVDVNINGRTNLMQPMKQAYPYTSFFNMVFNHDDSHADYLEYKELFVMDEKLDITVPEIVFNELTKNQQKDKAVNVTTKAISDAIAGANSKVQKGGNNGVNKALSKRAKRVAGGQSVTLSSRLHCPLFNTSKVLPTNMKIRITLTRNTDDFLLLCKDEMKYSVVIEDVYLQVTYFKPEFSTQQQIESLLEKDAIPYFIQRPELIVRPITSSAKIIRINDIFPDKLPSYAFFCLQKSVNFEGKKSTNPFKFLPMEKFNLFLGGKPYFQDGLEGEIETDTEKAEFSQFFIQLYKTIGKDYKGNCLLNSNNFYQHFCVGVSFTADKSPSNVNYLNLQERGSCSVEIDTGEDNGLTDSILLVYALFDRQIKINSNREIEIIE